VSTTMPALAAEAAGYRAGPEVGERFSLALRAALFERGDDVTDEGELIALATPLGVPAPLAEDRERVLADYEEGKRRGVTGSPHFFTPDGDDFFCPSLEISHEGGGISVSFDTEGFDAFVRAAFA